MLAGIRVYTPAVHPHCRFWASIALLVTLLFDTFRWSTSAGTEPDTGSTALGFAGAPARSLNGGNLLAVDDFALLPLLLPPTDLPHVTSAPLHSRE